MVLINYFIEVVVPLSLDKTFTYRVSEAEYLFLKKGMRVAVPFGKNKIYTALVVASHNNPPTLYEAKEIHQILDEKPIVNHPKTLAEVPATTEISDALSQDLKKRGFKFLGSTVVYAHMQATGMVNDHLTNCHCK